MQVNKYLKSFDISVPRYHKGYIIDHAGYKLIKKADHPNADKKGYVREHVLLMTEKLGRLLNDDECVHHIDGNKSNNDMDNLIVMLKYDHKCLHSRKPRKRRS